VRFTTPSISPVHPGVNLPITLDHADLASWLDRQPPDRPLYTDDGCVLATYLADHGFRNPAVGWDAWYSDDWPYATPLPAWARRFVRAIDREPEERCYREDVMAVLVRVLGEMANREWAPVPDLREWVFGYGAA